METDAVAFADMSLLNGVVTQFYNTCVLYTRASLEVLTRTKCDLLCLCTAHLAVAKCRECEDSSSSEL